MSGNTGPGSTSQVAGPCMHTYSNIVHGGTLPSGTGNTGVDPLFVDEVGGNLHIQTTSPARGAADPTIRSLPASPQSTSTGDTRVSPADIGADQFAALGRKLYRDARDGERWTPGEEMDKHSGRLLS